ncbi:hypothetical protein Aam_114_029 [Acidocella aminolytica 101 = DSM 11237]|uniref:Response regulatory domain-containing protein n=1 Tax=Acidocella aminolytica 101 = DSM 11237 TaxID=1120923 RepID=A0A0D6PJ96_9PROT|nr:hypothetical protein Aam_114_029 [Acidocella aminolytica 101 = DSM 11237]GBQ36081.1 hypothetical protein AA11237_1141 [Acidocella aminolytica 101 = DSM 11237]
MKILLADSNEARREALAAQLTKPDASFSVIPLASEAFLLAEVERLRPNVVLVDMARPDHDMLDSLPRTKQYATGGDVSGWGRSGIYAAGDQCRGKFLSWAGGGAGCRYAGDASGGGVFST